MGDFEMVLNHTLLFRNRCALSTTDAAEVKNVSFSQRCEEPNVPTIFQTDCLTQFLSYLHVSITKHNCRPLAR